MPTQGFQQVQKHTQSLILAPQLRQSLKILQAPAMELRTAILEELQVNPSLEELPMEGMSLDEGADTSETSESETREMDFNEDDFTVLNRMREDWQDYYQEESGTRKYNKEDDEKRKHFFDSFVSETSLQEHLINQADLADLDSLERKAMEYLIGSLDRDGFLAEELPNIALMIQLPLGKLQSVQSLLQTFNPIGVGSNNRRECLLFQLEMKGKEESLAARILRDEYNLLLRRRIPELARKFAVDVDSVHRALEEISILDPAPGRKFAEDNNRVIVPDVKVFQNDDGDWDVVMNSDYIPRLRINKVYKDWISSGKLPVKEKEYLKEKIRSGRFLMNSIEQRQQTIERITREIIALQKDFFEKGVSRMKPLTMNRIAEIIGVHETTVSRAIANKYMETPYGIFEFKYFFTAGYTHSGGEEVSNRSIKEAIQHIVDAEDPSSPLSDQKIVRILLEKGYTIARRTVAKYREELGILPTNLRRQYK